MCIQSMSSKIRIVVTVEVIKNDIKFYNSHINNFKRYFIPKYASHLSTLLLNQTTQPDTTPSFRFPTHNTTKTFYNPTTICCSLQTFCSASHFITAGTEIHHDILYLCSLTKTGAHTSTNRNCILHKYELCNPTLFERGTQTVHWPTYYKDTSYCSGPMHRCTVRSLLYNMI